MKRPSLMCSQNSLSKILGNNDKGMYKRGQTPDIGNLCGLCYEKLKHRRDKESLRFKTFWNIIIWKSYVYVRKSYK